MNGDIAPQVASVSPKKRDAGPKACTGCHTTRTPQWREGPSGPKTLCNACGVRRVRRNKGRSPHSDVATVTPSSPSTERESIESGGEEQISEVTGRHHEASSIVKASLLSRRPRRKAAVKAASRTAEFATTGGWSYDQAKPLLSPDGHVLYSAPRSPAAASSDTSVGGSDSAEEFAWAPQSATVEAALDAKACCRQDTSAAIDLLIMNYKETAAASPSSASGPRLATQSLSSAPSLRRTLAAGESAVAEGSVSATPGTAAISSRPLAQLTFLHANSVLSAAELEVERTLRTSFPDQFAQYEALQSQAEASWRLSAASEAAMAAVAEFLAQKQAAAIKARHAARAMTQELHAFLHQAEREVTTIPMPSAKRARHVT